MCARNSNSAQFEFELQFEFTESLPFTPRQITEVVNKNAVAYKDDLVKFITDDVELLPSIFVGNAPPVKSYDTVEVACGAPAAAPAKVSDAGLFGEATGDAEQPIEIEDEPALEEVGEEEAEAEAVEEAELGDSGELGETDESNSNSNLARRRKVLARGAKEGDKNYVPPKEPPAKKQKAPKKKAGGDKDDKDVKPEGGPKRVYQRTGFYSSDPVARAQALYGAYEEAVAEAAAAGKSVPLHPGKTPKPSKGAGIHLILTPPYPSINSNLNCADETPKAGADPELAKKAARLEEDVGRLTTKLETANEEKLAKQVEIAKLQGELAAAKNEVEAQLRAEYEAKLQKKWDDGFAASQNAIKQATEHMRLIQNTFQLSAGTPFTPSPTPGTHRPSPQLGVLGQQSGAGSESAGHQ